MWQLPAKRARGGCRAPTPASPGGGGALGARRRQPIGGAMRRCVRARRGLGGVSARRPISPTWHGCPGWSWASPAHPGRDWRTPCGRRPVAPEANRLLQHIFAASSPACAHSSSTVRGAAADADAAEQGAVGGLDWQAAGERNDARHRLSPRQHGAWPSLP